MGIIEKDIQEKPVPENDKKGQYLISSILDNLPPAVIINVDGPLADILSREAIDSWNAKARETLKGREAIERKAKIPRVDLSDERPIFLDGDEPMDFPERVNRWVK